MTESHPRTESIFSAALAIGSAAERGRYLDQACGGDVSLRAQIEELLAAYPKVEQFLEAPAAETGLGGTTAPSSEQPGTVIGLYKLVQEIGEGGMGTVWMAQQTEPVKRLVALKLIKPGMDSKQVIARFEAERQALALMDHPHIAHVFDGGQTVNGRPYFVMELVRGIPITDFCDERRLPIRARLELFTSVCHAVQHAHQKGIIHRDLKPSNILITLHDERPVVKVIDFGIAKATGQSLTDKTLVTGFAQWMGTPLYMSPEQTRLSGLDVDTRSDVYSLGVLLYELLTGTTPFDKERLKTLSGDEIRRVIHEEEPPRPSTRLSTPGPATATVSANRQCDARKLSQVLRGDLDWLVMKALEKDRNRRYESASALAADVQRYLHDEPVLACPPSVAYRLRKFVRRHKGPVLATGLLTLMLAAGVLGTAIGLLRALAAERQAVTARDEKAKALRQTRQALNATTDEVVEDLLGRQFELTERHRGFLKKVLAFHEAFAAAQSNDPEGRQSQADGYYHVGRIRQSLGQLPEAEAALVQARTLYQHLVAEVPDTLDSRHGLVRCDLQLGQLLTEGTNVGHGDRLKDAEGAFREAVFHCKQLVATSQRIEFREDLTRSEDSLAVQLLATGRAQEAEPLYRDALAINSELAQEFPHVAGRMVSLATAYDNLGLLLSNTHRPKEAADAYRQAIALNQRLVATSLTRPESHETLAKAYLFLGVDLGVLRKPKEAEEAFRKAAAVGRELAAEFPLRSEVRDVLALTLNNLGRILQQSRRLAEAESTWREALALYQQLARELSSRPDMRLQVAVQYHNLGIALIDSKRPKEGEEAWRAGIAVGTQLVKDFPKRTDFRGILAFNCDELGYLLREHGRLPEAVAAWRNALAHYQQLGAADALVRTHCNLGAALQEVKGQREAATAEYRLALRLAPNSARAHYELGNVLFPERVDDAIAEYREVIRIKPDYAEAHNNLANALGTKGDLDGAIREYREALRLNKDLFQAHLNLGVTLTLKDRLDEAIHEYHEALRLNNQHAGAHARLGLALQTQGRPAKAVAEYREALRLNKDDAVAQTGLREADPLARLERRLPAMLEGKDKPKEADEFLRVALLCQSDAHQQYAHAVRFFADAFSEAPALAEDLKTANRYNAACAAARANSGQGRDTAGLDARAGAQLRRQAREWLQADLAAWGRVLAREPQAAGAVASTLQHWLEDPDLASVREPAALAKLSEAERTPWQNLWRAVRTMHDRAQGGSHPTKKPDTK